MNTPLPDDIFAVGFDQSLNRGTGITASENIGQIPDVGSSDSIIYSGVAGTPAQDMSFGNITSGSGTNTFGADASTGIWLGAVNFLSAPFRVTRSGVLTASAVNITGGTLTIGSSASIDANGNATFTGLTSLSIKSYTDFENSARFDVSNVGGTGANTFNTSGMLQATGATSSSYARTKWFVSPTGLSGNPTFSTVISLTALNAASGAGQAFYGLGDVTIDGSGLTLAGTNVAGFYLVKTAGVVSLYTHQHFNNGSDTGTSDILLLTNLVDGDVLDLIIKINPANTVPVTAFNLTGGTVDYYYRKNVGTLSKYTLSVITPPTGTSSSATFGVSNVATAFGFSIQVVSASYER
jgi:hypothetical protein